MKFIQALFTSLILLLPAHALAMGNDDPLLTYFQFDELGTNGTETEWKVNAWMGYDLNKLYFKSEGHMADGSVEEYEYQFLYSRAVSAYWDSPARHAQRCVCHRDPRLYRPRLHGPGPLLHRDRPRPVLWR